MTGRRTITAVLAGLAVAAAVLAWPPAPAGAPPQPAAGGLRSAIQPAPPPAPEEPAAPRYRPHARPAQPSPPPPAAPEPSPQVDTSASTASSRTDPPPAEPAGPRTVTLSPITAYGDQAAVDSGALVTWMTSPTCLLAGHDSMGWAWLDDLPTGTRVHVAAGPCSGAYAVTGHRWQQVKGGPVPAWMAGVDLVLQTCTGAAGTGFALAERVR